VALRIDIIDMFAVGLTENPENIADILDRLESAGANPDFMVTHRDPRDPQAILWVTPLLTERHKEVSDTLGFYHTKNVHIRVEGESCPGVLGNIFRSIACAVATFPGYTMFQSGGRFLLYIAVDSLDAAEQVVHAMREMELH
jgi:hypothetical protein